MERVLILGADGQLGGEFARAWSGRVEVVATDLPRLDVCDDEAVRRVVSQVRPDTIVNCAAWNAVDLAETSALDALAVNATAVGHLARLAATVDAALVHFSTDFVFDGAQNAPYRETDEPRPVSKYGVSKLLGELACDWAPRHYVLRLSSLYGGRLRRSYVDAMAAALDDGRETRAFVDRTVSPSFAPGVVDATERLLAAHAPSGIYHCASSDSATWYGVGREIARLLGRDERLVVPIPFVQQEGRASRPRCCALSVEKLESIVGKQPGWRDDLARYLTSRQQAPVFAPESHATHSAIAPSAFFTN